MKRARLSVLVASSALCLAAFLAAALPGARAQQPRTRNIITIPSDGAYLGIEMEEVTADNMTKYKLNSERGVIARSVAKGSPAAEAGLQDGDVILELAGMPVFSMAQFSRMVREMPPGRKVDIVVSRDGKKLNLTAKLGERENSQNRFGIAPFPPGMQNGGPLFDFDGHDFYYGPGRQGARPFAFSFRNEKPRLGVSLVPLTDQLAEFLGVASKKGALVSDVNSGSPAAGRLKAGDVVVKANDKTIEDPADLSQVVNAATTKLDLRVVRDKKEISVTVELPKKGDSESKLKGYKL